MSTAQQKPRYHALDALRGLSVLLMIVHHFAFDLDAFGLMPQWLLYSTAVSVLHIIFASVFISLSGASNAFTSRKLSRGLRIVPFALVVTVVTYFFDKTMFVRFGILHLLAAAAIIYYFAHKLVDRVHGGVWLALFFAALLLLKDRTFDVQYLYIFGFKHHSFASMDYYPLLPWIFMYFLGCWLGARIKENRFPRAFYTYRSPFFEWVGKNSLWIYILHQPILYPVAYGLSLLLG